MKEMGDNVRNSHNHIQRSPVMKGHSQWTVNKRGKKNWLMTKVGTSTRSLAIDLACTFKEKETQLSKLKTATQKLKTCQIWWQAAVPLNWYAYTSAKEPNGTIKVERKISNHRVVTYWKSENAFYHFMGERKARRKSRRQNLTAKGSTSRAV